MSDTVFEKKVHKSERVIEERVDYSAQINGYDVTFTEDDNHGSSLSIYPADSRIFPRADIITCRPERVGDIDKLAENLPELLRAIAGHLRSLGKDDLRSRFEREHEQLMATLEADARQAQ